MRRQATRGLPEQTTATVVEILKRHDIVRAAIFGSVARGDATTKSDLDLLVEFPEGKSLLDLARLESELRVTLGRRVDVVTYRSLHPLIRDRALSEQIPIL